MEINILEFQLKPFDVAMLYVSYNLQNVYFENAYHHFPVLKRFWIDRSEDHGKESAYLFWEVTNVVH